MESLGGIVTKAVSPEPRAGHPAPRVAEFSGGMLNAVGLANPGLEHVVQHELPWLEVNLRRARLLVNVVGSTIDDFVAVVERLDRFAVVTAFELNLSCPNTERGGEEFSADSAVLASLVSCCRRATAKPLVVKLGPSLPDVAAAAKVAEENGADGFSLVNTLPSERHDFRSSDGDPAARLGFGKGGVSGPALLQLGLEAVSRVRERTPLPIIGIGGISTYGDLERYLAAGATLVAVGTAALADPRVPGRLVREWARRG